MSKIIHAGELTTNQLVMYNLDDYLLGEYLMRIRQSFIGSKLSTFEKDKIIERERLKIVNLDVTDEDKEIAKKTIAFQKNKPKEEVLKLNEFEFNMYSILNDDTDILIGTAAPRVAYSVPIYLKIETELNKQALIDKLNNESTYEVPNYFALEKQKFEQLELKFISYKYSYDEFYSSDNYIMQLKTLSGQDVYIKHSGAMDSLPLDLFDEDNNLKPAEVISGEYEGIMQ